MLLICKYFFPAQDGKKFGHFDSEFSNVVATNNRDFEFQENCYFC
jgi:hypothetical protein